ncbi:MAG: YhcH/YjgK/YiaL family protein [Bacteroidales bacterium]
MILGSLKNTSTIEKYHPLFKKAFDFVKASDFPNLKDGKFEIEGTDLFLVLETINGKTEMAAVTEAHRKYIDIQIPLTGNEALGWIPLQKCIEIKSDYNEQKDLIFFENEPSNFIKVEDGDFLIFFPEDGHAPGIGEGVIRKVIVKVRV